jgi:hypothetical protein
VRLRQRAAGSPLLPARFGDLVAAGLGTAACASHRTSAAIAATERGGRSAPALSQHLEQAPGQHEALTVLHQICGQKDLPVAAEALC